MLPSRQITSINVADTFAHSLLGVTDRIKNVSHVLVEALVTQVSTPDGYTAGFAALAGYTNATLRFLQAIEPTHCFCLVDKPMKTRNKVAAAGSRGRALARDRMINGQDKYRPDSGHHDAH
jgi:hypothetical protein